MMSRVPIGTSDFLDAAEELGEALRHGDAATMMPTSPRLSAPLFFSTISWASRTRVRSISEAA